MCTAKCIGRPCKIISRRWRPVTSGAPGAESGRFGPARDPADPARRQAPPGSGVMATGPSLTRTSMSDHDTIIRYGLEPSGAGGQQLPFSPAVRAGDFVYISGQVAMNERGEIEQGGIEAQTRRTMENVKKVLGLAGCGLSDVVKITVWLDDTRDFWTFNRVYREYFGEQPPARSCVRSQMMVDCKIEIEAIAYKPLPR
ncbi:RidA family protein [Lysobacter gummosus]